MNNQAMNTATPDLGQIRLLLAVADAPGFRRAALQLGLSPSALSQAIKRLEARLGQPLLLRSTRSVRLTEAGERLCAAAREALGRLDQAWQDLTPSALAPGGLQGRLRLSNMESLQERRRNTRCRSLSVRVTAPSPRPGRSRAAGR